MGSGVIDDPSVLQSHDPGGVPVADATGHGVNQDGILRVQVGKYGVPR